MTEFVALSEERIEELAAAATWTVPRPHYLNALSPARGALRAAASEASENTKRWLMEQVCPHCGTRHEETGGWCLASDTLRSEEDWLTRAEYLSRTEGR